MLKSRGFWLAKVRNFLYTHKMVVKLEFRAKNGYRIVRKVHTPNKKKIRRKQIKSIEEVYEKRNFEEN